MASGPDSGLRASLSKTSATYPMRTRDADLLAIRRGDARAFLTAMLQRVQPQVGHVGRFGMTEDAKDSTFLL